MIHLLFENQQFVWFAENEKSDCVSTIALSWWRDSDPRPADYESAALPLSHTSLFRRMNSTITVYNICADMSSAFRKNQDIKEAVYETHTALLFV